MTAPIAIQAAQGRYEDPEIYQAFQLYAKQNGLEDLEAVEEVTYRRIAPWAYMATAQTKQAPINGILGQHGKELFAIIGQDLTIINIP